jgi:hypothetical protein
MGLHHLHFGEEVWELQQLYIINLKCMTLQLNQ